MNEFSPQPSSTTEIQHQPDTREQTPEAIKNPRIQRLIQVRNDAERQLQEAITDFTERENKPAFIKAMKLFLAGVFLERFVDEDSRNTHIYIHDDQKQQIFSSENYFSEPIEESALRTHFGIEENIKIGDLIKHMLNIEDEIF
jgi:hypothetical protein